MDVSKIFLATLIVVVASINISYATALSKRYLFLEAIPSDSWFNNRLPVYDAPNGEIIGSYNLIITDSWCLLDWKVKDERVLAVGQDTFTADLCWNPIVYAEEKGFYQVLINSYPGGVWVKKENTHSSIPNAKAVFKPRTIISTIINTPTFAFKYKSGLVVRSKPSPVAESVVVVGENRIIVRATGNIEGIWAEVEVYEVNGYPTEKVLGEVHPLLCAGKRSWEPFKVKSFIGWIKALDDDGLPGDISWSTRC